ncbi:hypothetical protein C7S17_4824 [Burkholderia thailandensis]|nr:hypothetical protein [Burkholderia thailandensis]
MLVNCRVPIVLSPILQRCDFVSERAMKPDARRKRRLGPGQAMATSTPVIARTGANVSNAEFKRPAPARRRHMRRHRRRHSSHA